MKHSAMRRLGLSVATAISLMPAAALAEGRLQPADPTLQGSPAASFLLANPAANFGALPMGPADVKAKAAADRDARAAAGKAPGGSSPSAAAGDPTGVTQKATISGGHQFLGRFDPNASPPSMSGAIGATRYVQAVNNRVGIYNPETHGLLGKGTLNQLAGVANSVSVFDAQILWDAQTNRFYYVMNAVYSTSNNRLAFGFSKTASPTNSTSDWCHYSYPYGNEFPGFPRLGDSRDFIIVGVNTYTGNQSTFLGSDIVAIAKPPAGSNCPNASTLETGEKLNLRDTGGDRTFTPVPANAVDLSATGYVVARNGALPSNRLWLYKVRRAASGAPVFTAAGGVSVANYALPPNAPAGRNSNRLLTTLDARPTQAVLAVNPERGTLSFWVQHTVRHATQNRSVVRWYEINPATLALLRQGEIGNSSSATTFVFNGAISPDRRVQGSLKQFGDSFVIGYTVTKGGSQGINPRLVMGSSVNGGLVGNFVNVRNSPGPYVDLTCPGSSSTCRWGDSASASPDPFSGPGSPARGVVWFTSEFGSGGTSTTRANWRTWIWAARP